MVFAMTKTDKKRKYYVQGTHTQLHINQSLTDVTYDTRRNQKNKLMTTNYDSNTKRNNIKINNHTNNATHILGTQVNLSTLPNMLTAEVFSYLNVTDLILVSTINRYWCKISNYDILWSNLFYSKQCFTFIETLNNHILKPGSYKKLYKHWHQLFEIALNIDVPYVIPSTTIGIAKHKMIRTQGLAVTTAFGVNIETCPLCTSTTMLMENESNTPCTRRQCMSCNVIYGLSLHLLTCIQCTNSYWPFESQRCTGCNTETCSYCTIPCNIHPTELRCFSDTCSRICCLCITSVCSEDMNHCILCGLLICSKCTCTCINT
jgi:hypothetical protein